MEDCWVKGPRISRIFTSPNATFVEFLGVRLFARRMEDDVDAENTTGKPRLE